MFSFPLWLSLAILTGLASVCFNYFNRLVLKDGDDSTSYAWYTEFLRFIVFGIFAIFNWHIILTPYSLFLFLLFGLSEFIAGYWYMKMHAYSHLSISSILSRTRLIWIPIIAFFLIGEKLHLADYLGILIIFLGINLTMAPQKLFMDKGAMYANLSAFVIAINVVLAKMLLPYGSNSVINVALVLPSVILFPIFMKNAKMRIHKLFHTNIWLKTIGICFSIVQLFVFIAALRYGEASKVNAVYQSMMIFSVLAGIILLDERKDISKKLIGSAITIIGVIILSLY